MDKLAESTERKTAFDGLTDFFFESNFCNYFSVIVILLVSMYMIGHIILAVARTVF